MSSGHAEPRTWSAEDLENATACPVCASRQRTVIYRSLVDRTSSDAPGDWTLHQCDSCGSGWIDPRPTTTTIGRLYEQYYTHSSASPTSVGHGAKLLNGYVAENFGYDIPDRHRLGRWVVPLIPGGCAMASQHVRHLARPANGGRLLDIGCGDGAFLSRMRDVGWDVAGVEPDPRAAERARDAGLEVIEGQAEQGMFAEGSFTAITMSHVIEHLHDPVSVLHACFSWLVPGGTLWVATPNFEARLRRSYGRWWAPLDPPRHLVLFTRRSLALAMREAGFTDLEEPPVTLQASSWVASRSEAFRRGARDDQASHASLGARVRGIGADLRTLTKREAADEVTLVGVRP